METYAISIRLYYLKASSKPFKLVNSFWNFTVDCYYLKILLNLGPLFILQLFDDSTFQFST